MGVHRMRRGLLVALAALLVPAAVGCDSGPPAGPERVVVVPGGAGTPLGYVARLPPGYSAQGSHRYPTVVFLHGYGERGAGDPAGLALMMSVGLPGLVTAHRLPRTAGPLLILMPQTDGETWDPALLHRWLAAVLPRYRVDPDRTYLTGLSMGGGGAAAYLAAYGAQHQFAAVATVAENWTPQPVPLGLPPCHEMESTPLWAFHGDLDDTVPKQTSINLVAYLNAHCRPTEPARLTLFLSTFHDAWDRTYDLSGMDPGATDGDWDPYTTDVYTWLLRHRRG